MSVKGLKGGLNEKYQYICHSSNSKPALCVTVAAVVEDRSKELVRNSAGIGTKFVAAIPLTYEYERWVATIAMVLGGRTFKSQITENKLVFSTRPETKGPAQIGVSILTFRRTFTDDNAISTDRNTPHKVKSQLTSSKCSPSTIKSSASSSDINRFVLQPEDQSESLNN